MAERRRWTQETIETEVAPTIAELGRMPTRRELTDRGLGGAWSAMQRHGGLPAWRERLTQRRAALAGPSPIEIAERAYFIFEARGGDPIANWLTAERQLSTA